MESKDPSYAILPADLGAASAFDQRVFPLEYYEASGNLTKGSVLIKATLEEMEAIKQLGIDLNKNDDFIFNTRVKLEDLNEKRGKLQDNRKTFNLLKLLLKYRAGRLFHAASRALYLQTTRTSEKIHREEGRVRVVSTIQMRAVDGAIPPNVTIGGFAIELPDGLTENAERTINDARETIATSPFQDNSVVSQLREGEHAMTLADTESLLSQDAGADEGDQTSGVSSDLQQSRPTSPQTINHINIYHSIVTANSNLNGLTYNRGSRNSGASITQELAP